MLLVPTARGDTIHDVNATARRLGLAPGQRATDAAAAHHDMAVAYGDPKAEAEALDRLVRWARRWTPFTRRDGVDGIALDATGCEHLFGGPSGLVSDVRERLERLDLTVRVASASNHAAAHALSRFGSEKAQLRDLPVEALRIDPASVTLLRRLGLKTIGDLDCTPRPALKKRFGSRRRHRDPRDETWDDYLGRSIGATADVLARLDEAMDRAFVPFGPERDAEPLRIAKGLVEPVLDTDVILASTRPLLDELMARLARRDVGVLALALEAFRVDGGRAATLLRLSRPSRETSHLMRLLVDRLDGWHAEFGFDALAVEAVETAVLPPAQVETSASRRDPDLHALVDRLRARLGERSVRRAALRRSHVPERAQVWIAGEGGNEDAPPVRGSDRMFEFPEEVTVLYGLPEGPPARFTWRHHTHLVEKVAGPERIAPEWWRERSHVRARDYFHVETREGRRFWIYREGFDGDERGAVPRWFVHGLFS